MRRYKTSSKVAVAAVAALIVIAGAVAITNRHKNVAAVVVPQTTESATPTPTPSPGQPGNPGDEAKQSLSSTPTPTPTPGSTPTPTPASVISITGFTASPQTDGSVTFANEVSGVDSATCSIALSGPNQQTSSATGTYMYAGTYYFCSFGKTVNNITTSGTWTAKLTVTSGATSSAATTTFTK